MGISESADPGRNLARFAAFVALIVGVFVLAGWSLDMEQLTNIVPGWPRMVRLTAVAFMLAGASLVAGVQRCRAHVHERWPALLAMPRYRHGARARARAGTSISISCRWRPIPPAVDGMPPPRMAPATAFAFPLLGTVAVVRRATPQRAAAPGAGRRRPAGGLAGPVALSCSAASRCSPSRTWRCTPRCCSCCPVPAR